jgi:hypothetical protein
MKELNKITNSLNEMRKAVPSIKPAKIPAQLKPAKAPAKIPAQLKPAKALIPSKPIPTPKVPSISANLKKIREEKKAISDIAIKRKVPEADVRKAIKMQEAEKKAFEVKFAQSRAAAKLAREAEPEVIPEQSKQAKAVMQDITRQSKLQKELNATISTTNELRKKIGLKPLPMAKIPSIDTNLKELDKEKRALVEASLKYQHPRKDIVKVTKKGVTDTKLGMTEAQKRLKIQDKETQKELKVRDILAQPKAVMSDIIKQSKLQKELNATISTTNELRKKIGLKPLPMAKIPSIDTNLKELDKEKRALVEASLKYQHPRKDIVKVTKKGVTDTKLGMTEAQKRLKIQDKETQKELKVRDILAQPKAVMSDIIKQSKLQKELNATISTTRKISGLKPIPITKIPTFEDNLKALDKEKLAREQASLEYQRPQKDIAKAAKMGVSDTSKATKEAQKELKIQEKLALARTPEGQAAETFKQARAHDRVRQSAMGEFIQQSKLGEIVFANNQTKKEMLQYVNREGPAFLKTISPIKKFALNTMQATMGARGFKMELLGVMFAGQNLSKTMTNWLQPAIQARNITEKWSRTMRDLFLPIIRAIEPAIKSLSNTLKGMPTGLKLFIGGFVILVAILGQLAYLVGSFGLAIGSLIQLFGANWLGSKLAASGLTGMSGATAGATATTSALNGALAIQNAELVTNSALTKANAVAKGSAAALGTVAAVGGAGAAGAGVAGTAAAGGGIMAGLGGIIAAAAPVLLTVLAILAVVAVLALLGYGIYKIISGQKKLTSTTKKTEKAFKGSGLHAAIQATNKEMRAFQKNTKYTDFLLGISAQKVPWYTGIWTKFKDSLGSIWASIWDTDFMKWLTGRSKEKGTETPTVTPPDGGTTEDGTPVKKKTILETTVDLIKGKGDTTLWDVVSGVWKPIVETIVNLAQGTGAMWGMLLSQAANITVNLIKGSGIWDIVEKLLGLIGIKLPELPTIPTPPKSSKIDTPADVVDVNRGAYEGLGGPALLDIPKGFGLPKTPELFTPDNIYTGKSYMPGAGPAAAQQSIVNNNQTSSPTNYFTFNVSQEVELEKVKNYVYEAVNESKRGMG